MKRFLLSVVIALASIHLLSQLLYADVQVLCYHSFLGKKNVDYDFSIQDLRHHLTTLKNNGFRFITLGEFVQGNLKGGKNVLVSIDDGNHSVYDAYREVFKPMGIKPVLAIYPNIIDRQKYAMTWAQLKELSDDGCDIAAHGFFHLKINKKLHDSDLRSFQGEIYKSKDTIEKRLARKVDTFIYPFGLYTEITAEHLRKAGYKYAFTIERNIVRIPLERNANILRLPRYMMTRSNWKTSIATIMNNGKNIAAGGDVKISQEPVPFQAKAPAGASPKLSINKKNGIRHTDTHNATPKKRLDIRYKQRFGENDAAQSPAGQRGFEESLSHQTGTIARNTAEADSINTAQKISPDLLFAVRGKTTKHRDDNASRDGPREKVSPGRFKTQWDALSRNAETFYRKIIDIKFSRAERGFKKLSSDQPAK